MKEGTTWRMGMVILTTWEEMWSLEPVRSKQDLRGLRILTIWKEIRGNLGVQDTRKNQFMHWNTAPPEMSRWISDGNVEENNNGVDFLKILNQIDDHFLKASVNAQEVSKMLEAKQMHYHLSEFLVSFPTSQNSMAVAQVEVMMVSLPAQSHLNQLLHLSRLVSTLTTSMSSLLAPPPTTHSSIAGPTCLCTNHKSKSLPNNYFAGVNATHHYTPIISISSKYS
ncbi:Myb-related protein [Abeliophyllum distichum]|uniref:Myb-related protein n=1 Tax=Abeliophyllum distichum TaxID=126358 RepID=A0ABD1NNY7_9LAMI